MGLTEYGYHRPSYEEILEGKIQRAKKFFGEDIDTSETTPLGKFIRINAYDQSKEYEDIEAVYYARYPNTAIGTSLDRACVFAGISRNPAVEAQHTVRVYGDAGFSFGIGELIVSDNNGLTFYNVNNYTISDDGYVDVIVECAEAGIIGNVGSISSIVNPSAEIDRIEYVGVVAYGKEAESDTALRKRFGLAIKGQGGGTPDAIRGAVLRVPEVQSVGIIINEEDTADEAGRPAHSFEVYVYGGDGHEQEIAEAIFEKKAVGIKAVTTAAGEAAINAIVYDTGNNAHSISFTKGGETIIKINFDLYVNSDFATDNNVGLNEIKERLVGYIESIGVGGTVVYTEMFGFIYGTEGVKNVRNLQIAKNDGAFGTSDIECGENECPTCGAVDITVNIITVGG